MTSNISLASTNVTLNDVFKTARDQSKSTVKVIGAIKACKLDWTNADAVAIVGDTYKAGRISGALEVSEKTARGILAAKPHKDGDSSDDRRTFAEHMAARAAISAWSTIRLLAGAPSAQTGGKRAPRMAKDAAGDESATGEAGAVIPAVTRAKTEADVHAYALRMAGNMTKYVNLNAKLVTGSTGDAIRGFIAAIAAIKN